MRRPKEHGSLSKYWDHFISEPTPPELKLKKNGGIREERIILHFKRPGLNGVSLLACFLVTAVVNCCQQSAKAFCSSAGHRLALTCTKGVQPYELTPQPFNLHHPKYHKDLRDKDTILLPSSSLVFLRYFKLCLIC